jgi:hypothetical protein
MRALTYVGSAVLMFALVLVVPSITTGQPGGGKKGMGGGGMGGPRDPGQTFDFMTNGKGTLAIDKLFFGQEFAKQFAKDKGITNGQFTREQYIEFSTAYSEYRRASGGGKGYGKMGGGTSGAAPGSPQFPGQPAIPGQPGGGGGSFFKKRGDGSGNPGGPAAPPVQVNPDLIKQLADESFKRLDANSDGKLNQDEMSGMLRAQVSKWDKNNDTYVDLPEYREFFAAQLGGGVDSGTRGVPDRIIDDEELDKKPVVFRQGKLPSGLPPWFKELDKEPEDGVVALNEWRAASKDLDEFKTFDLNDDGLITIDEALRVNLAANNKTGNGASAAAGPNGQRPPGFGPGNGKGDGFKKKKKGG